MIDIKLNNKNHSIPSYSELTVNQLIKLKEAKEANIINYLSVVTGLKFIDVSKLKVKNPNALAIRIGSYKDYTKVTPQKTITIGNTKYFGKNLTIETLGQRFMIEEHAKELKDEEYMCYLLAVAILGSEMDYEKINALKIKIMDQPYLNVLPTGFFLQKILWTGKILETNSLVKSGGLINTLLKRSRLALMNYQLFLVITKFKRWLNY